jgi:hypothetical protein
MLTEATSLSIDPVTSVWVSFVIDLSLEMDIRMVDLLNGDVEIL